MRGSREIPKAPEDVEAREGFFTKLNTDPGFSKMVRDGMNLMMLDSFEKEGGDVKRERRDSGVYVMREKMGAVSGFGR